MSEEGTAITSQNVKQQEYPHSLFGCQWVSIISGMIWSEDIWIEGATRWHCYPKERCYPTYNCYKEYRWTTICKSLMLSCGDDHIANIPKTAYGLWSSLVGKLQFGHMTLIINLRLVRSYLNLLPIHFTYRRLPVMPEAALSFIALLVGELQVRREIFSWRTQ